MRWLEAADGDDADEIATRIGDAVTGDDDFARHLFESSFRAYLGGQLFVRSIELADDAGEPGTVTLSATRRDPTAFLAMPFADAVEFFRGKSVLTLEEFDAIEDRFRQGGFVARDLASVRMQETARALIERLLTQGMSLDEVRRALRDAESSEAAALGITPASPGYIDNVVQTNVAVSYGAGRWSAMNDPNVVALRPYTQVRTSGDARVRASHALLDGAVFELGSDLAAYYARPGGFRCRCGNVTLSRRQFEARGLVLTTERIPGADPDPGWEGAPAPLA